MRKTCRVTWSMQRLPSARVTGRYNSLCYAQCPEIRHGSEMAMKFPRWLGRPYIHAAALILSLLAALAFVAFMAGTFEYTKTRGKLLLTALLVAGYFLITLLATATPRDGVMRWLYVSIFFFATMALFLLLVGLWATPDSDEFWKSAASLTFLTLGMSLAGLALRASPGVPVARALAWASATMAVVMTAMTVLGIALEIRDAAYWWAFALLALCWLAASIALASARLWRRRKAQE